jgi:hypothetical protein
LTYFRRPVTPAEIAPALRALIEELVPGGQPVYVDVQPLEGAPANECFPLVEEMARRHGGELLVGWSLWEFPTLFVEAEFHGVWRMADGRLMDPAPKQESTQRVLFLHDPHRSYTGAQVNNERRAVRSDPLLKAYFRTFDAEFELLNRGERATQHGMVSLLDDEAQEMHDIQLRREQLHFQLLSSFPAIGPYHPCPCGSGQKVRWCHRGSAA